MFLVSITYDRDVDALYASLRPRAPADVARTVELGGERQVDYDREGNVLGVEFLNASDGLDFDGVPQGDEIRATLRSLARFADV